MERKVMTRMGDGALVEMTRSELRADIESRLRGAAATAKVPPLTQDELDHLLEIYASPARFTGVDIGSEVVLSFDGSGMKTIASRIAGSRDLRAVVRRRHDRAAPRRLLLQGGQGHRALRAQEMHDVLQRTVAPVQYGAQPNLGLYSKPDGPCDNWSELLPLTRIDEARAAQEEAVPLAVKDMVYVAEAMHEAGADGLDFDTSAAAGDADFLATLLAVEEVRRRCPDLGIEVGMSGEFVLGMHGRVDLPGSAPGGPVAEGPDEAGGQAGATIFGPVVNVKTGKSCAWNVARACTIVKPCMAEATIPIHMNVGMGVGGVR